VCFTQRRRKSYYGKPGMSGFGHGTVDIETETRLRGTRSHFNVNIVVRRGPLSVEVFQKSRPIEG
jgi:hypothetical protein